MKIKIELYLPFQKLEQYNIETDLDDIIQALHNSDIKQEVLDSILKHGLYDSDGHSLSLRRNKAAETILTHPIYSPKEVVFLNNLNVLEDDKFLHIKIHYYSNVKSGEKYSEIVIDGEENQNTLLIGGPYDISNTIANEKETAKYEDALNANLIEKMKVDCTDDLQELKASNLETAWTTGGSNPPGAIQPILAGSVYVSSQYLIRLKDFKFEEWLNKFLLSRKEMAAKIKLSDELARMMNLLKSDNEISIKLYSREEWHGDYIDSEGDDEEWGGFTTESSSVVSKDFLLNKLNEFVMGIQPNAPFRRTRSTPLFLDNEGDWLKDVEKRELALSKATYVWINTPEGQVLSERFYEEGAPYEFFADWIGVRQGFDDNPEVFEATDVEYSEPWDWGGDDTDIEHAETFLEITSGDKKEMFLLFFKDKTHF